MNITYKLLDNEKGVLITRKPTLVERELLFDFTTNEPNLTAVFETNRHSFYRELHDGKCTLSAHKLFGKIKISVIQSHDHFFKKWICEELLAETTPAGMLITPDARDVSADITTLRIENAELRKQIDKLSEMVNKLEQKLTNIMEGYDLI